MNTQEKLKLNDMMKEGDCVDNTETIRKLKHSSLITRDLNTILQIKKKMRTNDFKTLDSECIKHCRFLFDNYTNTVTMDRTLSLVVNSNIYTVPSSATTVPLGYIFGLGIRTI